MKTKLFYILMTAIVMGMVIPVFAGSPDKKQWDNTKKETPATSLTPLTDWTFNIIVTDPNDSCQAYKNCQLEFYIQAATAGCEGVSSYPTFTPIPIVKGQRSYQGPTVPSEIPCVKVSIIKVNPLCQGDINSNTCCACFGGGPCYLKICPWFLIFSGLSFHKFLYHKNFRHLLKIQLRENKQFETSMRK